MPDDNKYEQYIGGLPLPPPKVSPNPLPKLVASETKFPRLLYHFPLIANDQQFIIENAEAAIHGVGYARTENNNRLFMSVR